MDDLLEQDMESYFLYGFHYNERMSNDKAAFPSVVVHLKRRLHSHFDTSIISF